MAHPDSAASGLRESLEMKIALVTLLAIGITPLFASDPAMIWTLEYAGSYDTDWNAIDQSSNLFGAGLHPAGYDPMTLNMFNVYFQATGLAAGQDIKWASADLTLGKGLTAVDVGGKFLFSSEECTIQVKKPWPQLGYRSKIVPVFESTSDSGTPGDLLGLQASMTAAVGYYNHFGKAAPMYLGTVFLTWDAAHVADLKVNGGPAGTATWTIWSDNTTRDPFHTTTQDMNSAIGQTMTFGTPEPATLSLLVVGALAMLKRRGLRR
jgi:hypothetical protein